MLLVPVICFCLPCVIRVLGMLQGPQRRKGARQEEIEKLPTGLIQSGLVFWGVGEGRAEPEPWLFLAVVVVVLGALAIRSTRVLRCCTCLWSIWLFLL